MHPVALRQNSTLQANNHRVPDRCFTLQATDAHRTASEPLGGPGFVRGGRLVRFLM